MSFGESLNGDSLEQLNEQFLVKMNDSGLAWNSTIRKWSKIQFSNWNRFYPNWSKLHQGIYYRLSQLRKHVPEELIGEQLGPYRHRIVMYDQQSDDGDCLFDAVAVALTRRDQKIYDSFQVRQLVANQITSDNCDLILDAY